MTNPARQQYQAEYEKKQYQYYKSIHTCVTGCGRDSLPDRVLCWVCRDKQKRYQTPRRSIINKRNRDRRWSRIQQGICIKCGKGEPEEWYQMCTPCRLKNNIQAQERWHRKKYQYDLPNKTQATTNPKESKTVSSQDS